MRAVSAVFFGLCLIAAAPAYAQESVAPPVRGGGVTVSPERPKPTPPDGDPRSTAQRYEDRQAFNQCLLRMQSREDDFSRPGLPPDPMSYCQDKLGMANADAVPVKRRAP